MHKVEIDFANPVFYERIVKAAKDQKCSVSELVRDVLRNWLEENYGTRRIPIEKRLYKRLKTKAEEQNITVSQYIENLIFEKTSQN
jgi:predicted HicB family RNase H-like nuclease